MEDKVFINTGIEKCFQEYFKKNTMSFYSFIISTLCKIFDKLDIENSYKLDLRYDACGFMFILKRYGSKDKEIENFAHHVERFYQFEEKKCQIIEKKNPYLVLVLKDLIDFYFKKCHKLKLSKEEINEFYSDLYCMNSKSSYKRSYVFLKCEYPEEIDRYFKNKAYEYNTQLTFMPVKDNVLDMTVYEYLHIDPKSDDKNFLANKFINEMDLSKLKLNATSGQINIKAFLVIFGSIIVLGIIIGMLFVRW